MLQLLNHRFINKGKYFLLFICGVFFYSCSSSKKIKTDTHVEEKKDSVVVTHFDSSHLRKEISQDNREIIIEYEPYTGYDLNKPVEYYDNFRIFKGISGLPTKGLKSIRIRQSSSVQKVDSTKVIDQSFAESHSEIKEEAKTETVKKNEVELPSFNFKLWGIIAGVVLPLLIGGFIWWKKRKKKELRIQ